MKSLYSSNMMGADGVPMVLALSTSGAAATQGSSAANRSAKSLISFIVNRDGIGVFIHAQHRQRPNCDRLLRQHAIHVTLENTVAGPLAPRLAPTCLRD